MIKQSWPEQLSAQEVFDHVVEHLRAQEERCIAENDRGTLKCAYRSYDRKNACALGALLTDVEASAVIEAGRNNDSANGLITAGLMPARLLPHTQLIVSLQGIHDQYTDRPLAPDAERMLHCYADQHQLRYTPPASAVQALAQQPEAQPAA